MRFAVAIVLALHGFAHLVGFVVTWRIATLEEMPYKTTLLAGRVDVRDRGIRGIGILWLVAAVGFFVAGAAVILLLPWWIPFTFCVAVFSLVLCVLGWPDSKIGVFVNVGIFAYLLVAGVLGWLPGVAS